MALERLAPEKKGAPEGAEVPGKKGAEVRKWPLYGLAVGSLGLIAAILIFKPEWARAEEGPRKPPPEEVPPWEKPPAPPWEKPPEVPEEKPPEVPEEKPPEVPEKKPPEAVGRPKIRFDWSRYYVG